MTVVRAPASRQLAAAAVAQIVMLAALAPSAGLSLVGWLAGIAYAVGLCTLLGVALRRAGLATLGPADLVTLARAVLVGAVTALVADGLAGGATPVTILVVIATVALLLDAVDGRVARRTGTASALGARFDMELDACLLLVLSLHVAGLFGPWVLAIGLARYAFVAAGWVVPSLRRPVPPRYSAKAVAALQGIALVVASSRLLPTPVTVVLLATALVLLVWSFGGDVVWLRHSTTAGSGRDEPRRWRRIAAQVGTVLAALVVLAVLVTPDQIGQLTPAAFVRIPVEALVGVAILLVLPARAGRVVAAVAGVALGVLVIVKALDLGFAEVLGRPFDPVLDWPLLDNARDFLTESIGPAGATAAAIAAVAAAVAVLIVVPLSVVRMARLVGRHRKAALRAVAVLTPVWVVCLLVGAQIVPGVPVAAASVAGLARDSAVQVGAALPDQLAYSAAAAVDAFRDTPGDQLLTALRGKDVVVAFVESYGRSAVEDPEYASQVGAVLDTGSRRLSEAGFASRSAFLTSPTSGGISWLAHSTLQSGLWIDNLQRYRELVSSDRLTLTGAFERAGWRTVAVMPGISTAWPEAAFYGYNQVYDATSIGYRGPGFGWGTTPDQYTLSAFQRLERARQDRGPVMAEIPLVSSHIPWVPIPRLVDWGQVGDGSVYGPIYAEGERADVVWQDPARVRTEYRRSIEYSLNSLISYVQTYGDDNLVLVVLGDHQAGPIIVGEGATRDVPITIVSRDRAVLDRISGWGWQDGLKPGPQTPVWRMDAFRDRFLTAFGP